MATELHPLDPQDPPVPAVRAQPDALPRASPALHGLTRSLATPSSQNLLLPFLQQQLGVGCERDPGPTAAKGCC